MTEPVEFRCPVYRYRMFGKLTLNDAGGKLFELSEPLIVRSGEHAVDAGLSFACDDCRKAARPVPVRVLHYFDLTGRHVGTEALPVVPRRA